jgi:hypothetical protein
MHTITISENRVHEFERKQRGGIWEGLEGGNGRHKYCDYNLKKKSMVLKKKLSEDGKISHAHGFVELTW